MMHSQTGFGNNKIPDLFIAPIDAAYISATRTVSPGAFACMAACRRRVLVHAWCRSVHPSHGGAARIGTTRSCVPDKYASAGVLRGYAKIHFIKRENSNVLARIVMPNLGTDQHETLEQKAPP